MPWRSAGMLRKLYKQEEVVELTYAVNAVWVWQVRSVSQPAPIARYLRLSQQLHIHAPIRTNSNIIFQSEPKADLDIYISIECK